MDGSDDYYFSDDIILDDQTLAVLDSEEQKYLTQAVPPPAKRQKTDKGWKPAAAPARATVLDDNEDLPEISVHGDGTYAFRGANQDTRTIPPAPNKAFNVKVVPQPPIHRRVLGTLFPSQQRMRVSMPLLGRGLPRGL
ncbi:hypothetical protein B0H11DRAFT_385674 [Mycena galericulata]|nr:hypothetical protein B0H11DRAFT_385674 [Mycena galericulata]